MHVEEFGVLEKNKNKFHISPLLWPFQAFTLSNKGIGQVRPCENFLCSPLPPPPSQFDFQNPKFNPFFVSPSRFHSVSDLLPLSAATVKPRWRRSLGQSLSNTTPLQCVGERRSCQILFTRTKRMSSYDTDLNYSLLGMEFQRLVSHCNHNRMHFIR